MEGDSEATRSRPCSVRPCPGLSSNIHMQPLEHYKHYCCILLKLLSTVFGAHGQSTNHAAKHVVKGLRCFIGEY